MVCDERRARGEILPRIAHVSFLLAVALTAVMWKVSHGAVVVAVSLNVLDAALGSWTFRMLYVCGLPSACGHGLAVLRGYALPALNVATALYLLTDHAALRLATTLIGGSILALMLLFGVLFELFFKPYSRGLAIKARALFKERAGALSRIAAEYCDGLQRGFCVRQKTPRDGVRTFERTPRRYEVAKQFEDHYGAIRAEVVDGMDRHPHLFSSDYGYSENASGQWKSLNLAFHQGYDVPDEQKKRYEEAREHLPVTTGLMSALQADHQIAGEAFLSILTAGATLRPHRDYVAGTRTVHLGLIVPPDCALQVGEDTYVWKEGECAVFDPSFLHSAHNRSDRLRIVLLADGYDPAWTPAERAAIAAFKAWRARLTITALLRVTALGLMARITGKR